MNYTKTLRNYCLQNSGKLFDAGFMAEKYFPMIPYPYPFNRILPLK